MWLPESSLDLPSIIVMLVWLISFTLVLTNSDGNGSLLSDGQPPLRLACNTRLWHNTTVCGLDGRNCAPFVDSKFTFLCPSYCASVHVLEPHIVGNQEIIYDNMVIGGLSSSDGSSGEGEAHIYRGDSFICQAAIHAGIISNDNGGCGVLKRNGEHQDFAASIRNGISSIEFLPSFPLSYSLTATDARCNDPQWRLFALSLAASFAVSFLAVSSRFFVTSTFLIVFFQVALASDRPFYPDYSSGMSLALERFLPTTFVVFVLYQYCIRYTLRGLQAHVEKTLLWLGGCWIGALNNYTFDRIPISRLTARDLRQQPGAITALIIILAIIIAAAAGQALAFRTEGRLLRYIGAYLVVGLVLGCLAAFPNLQLRLHHYIIALLLLPGTSLQTRPSLLYQGLLLGLFINGIARWGYASILQTAEALREDGQLGSAVPQVLRPDLITRSSIGLTIGQLAKGFDGISILVDDVERYHEPEVSTPLIFNWTRTPADGPTFFRFAFTNMMPLGGISYGDYTKPSTWHLNGTWEYS